MVNNSTHINKTKESLNSDGQQFLQYKQSKSFVYIGGIVDYHCLNILLFVDIGGIVDYHCINFLLFR
jgi:hypothetical protein